MNSTRDLTHKRNKSQAHFISDMGSAIYSQHDLEIAQRADSEKTLERMKSDKVEAMSETITQVDTTTTTISGGVKHDGGKVMYHLFPLEAFDEINKVLAFGATKYAERNWEKGINFSRLFNSTLRHLFSWWRGENLDPETNLSHLAHAATNVIFLLTFVLRKQTDLDNRPK